MRHDQHRPSGINANQAACRVATNVPGEASHAAVHDAEQHASTSSLAAESTAAYLNTSPKH